MMHTDPILKFADRHAALNARGNLDTTSDDEANVIFDKVWKLEDQIFGAKPLSIKAVIAQLEVVASRMDQIEPSAEAPATAQISRALKLLERPKPDLTEAAKLVACAYRTVDDALEGHAWGQSIARALFCISNYLRDVEPRRRRKTRGALAPGAWVQEERWWQRLRQSKPKAPAEKLTEA